MVNDMNETIAKRPVGRPRKLKEADFALLGTDNDVCVAAKLGVSARTVCHARARLGIPAVRRHSNRNPQKKGPLFDIPIEEFSTTRDCDLAEKYGVTRERIRQVRVERSIPKCGKRGPVPRERRKCLACGGVLSLKTKGEHCIRCLVPHGRKTKPCEVCGKPFWKQQGVIRTCSKACASKLMSLSHGGSV